MASIQQLWCNIKYLIALQKKCRPSTKRYVALGQQIRRYRAAIHQLGG